MTLVLIGMVDKLKVFTIEVTRVALETGVHGNLVRLSRLRVQPGMLVLIGFDAYSSGWTSRGRRCSGCLVGVDVKCQSNG